MKKIEKVDFSILKENSQPRIGVIGVGHHTYWAQFPGLLEDMYKKQDVFIEKIPDFVDVVDFGLVDNAEKAYQAAKALRASNLDLLFCDMVTYATSGTFGIIMKTLNIPIVLVALQPLEAMDYSKANTYMQLSNDDICSLPEFTGVAARMGIKIPETIIGTLHNDKDVDKKIDEYCRIAKVLHGLKNAHFGHIGHSLNAMLDMHFDPTMFTTFFGCHIKACEANEIVKEYELATVAEVDAEKQRILSFFDTPDPVSEPLSSKLSDDDLYTAARVSVALDNFVVKSKINGLAYYYESAEGSLERLVMSNFAVGNSLLTAKNIPMCGESDVKTLIALFIMDKMGIGGSFAEFHPVDFAEDFVLVGHDGPHNITIADGKPILRSLTKFHGKYGSGAGVEFKIKTGPITMLSINSTYDGKFKFVIAEGESVEGLIPATGNTNTRGKFKPDVKSFLSSWMKEGPTHHFSLGIGHHASTIVKIANYLGLESVVVTN
ncbi:MAG: arabinose isomerase [Paludibacter sp.]